MSNLSDFIIENGILKKYVGSGGDVVIPAGVTSIGREAFWYKNLTSVTIPEGVTSIGDSAFYNCSSLTSVTIPEGVTSIGKMAFKGCNSLTSMMIPDSVTSIGNSAFRGCSSLTSVTIPEGVTSIGDSTFFCCSSLTSITIPASVTSISSEAFFCCQSLQNICFCGIPQSIELSAFDGCKDLCVSLPNGSWKTTAKLPACLSSFAEKMDAEGLAWVLLYQTAKSWRTAAFEAAKKAEPILVIMKQLEIAHSLKKLSAALAGNMLDTCAVFYDLLPDALVKEFAQLLEEKKCAKQLSALENDPALREKLVGKEQLLQAANPAERIVLEQLTAEETTLRALSDLLREMYGLKIVELPSLRSANGKECAPYVLAWLLTVHETIGSIEGDKMGVVPRYPNPGLCPKATEVTTQLDPASLQAAIMTLADQYLVIYQNTKKKFLCYPICRYANEATMVELTRRAPKWRSYMSGDDAPPLRQMRDASKYSDTRVAMLFAEQYHELDQYAALRGTDADTLRDTVLSDFGFDESGQKRYDLGSGTVTVSMAPDLTLSLYDDKAQKIVKSIPKKGADPEKYETAKKDLAQMNKNIKKVVKARNNLLLEAYLAGNNFQADRWAAVYTQNPVLNAVARLLVWVQEGNNFTLTDQGPTDVFGQEYKITDAPIRLAHPMEMQPDEVTAWQKHFNARGLKQPFAQVWEPVIDLGTVEPERYKGCMIPYYRFLGQEKHGITVTDEDFHNWIDISFADCQATVERIDEGYHEINVNDQFEIEEFSFKVRNRRVNHIVAYLDRVTVLDRVRKDDVEVMNLMPGFTLAQITEFIKVAQEANAVNVLALLLEYKNAHFADFDPMDEFTLEW